MNLLKLNTILSLRGLLSALVLAVILLAVGVGDALAQSAFDDPGSRTGAGKGGDLVATEGKIDAGEVALGSSSQVVILLRNDSSKPIKSSAISLYPSSNVSASVGENECDQQALPPDAVCAIALSVKGLQPGKFRIEMLMRHDGRTKLITSTVSGTVDRSNDSTKDIISDLETIPANLAFGTLKESRPLTRSIILRNVTSKAIGISSIEIESNEQAGYMHKTSCDKLLSGEACIVTVSWAPQQRGPATGVLVINHDGPTGVVSVILDGSYEPATASEVGIFPEAVPGKGLLTASQSDIDFGGKIESQSAITASLVNIGDAPLTIKNIRMSNEDNGIKISSKGCKTGTVLQPVEACPLTLVWEPVREGAILDDIQILHDGARGILVLPVRGDATKAVNQDSKAIVFGGEYGELLNAIPPISSRDVEGEPSQDQDIVDRSSRSSSSGYGGDASGALEGYKITSLATNRAIVSGPGGSRVIFDGQETVIGGVLWRVGIHQSAVEFMNGKQKVLLLFDRSLSSLGESSSSSVSSASNTPSAATEGQ